MKREKTRILECLLFPMLLWAGGCSSEEPDLRERRQSPLVVEGWIEDGDKPVVIVTRAADFAADSVSIESLVQRWCRVTVSDGEETELLSMRIDEDYIPSVVYTSSRLRGKVGHTYTLKVETDTDTVTAVTTIPPVARIDSVAVKGVEGSDSVFSVRAYADVEPTPDCHYKIFTKVNGERRYYSSFLGLFSGDEYDKEKGWNAARGIHNTASGHFTPNYHRGDTVRIKLCTLDAESYRFWESYETAVSLQSNFFFATTAGCEWNVTGGKGYWAGYGASFARIVIK